MRASLLLFASLGAAAQSLLVNPPLATQCNSLGQATVSLVWSAGENTRLLVESPTGLVPMTGVSPANGRVLTGPWVTDGMTFVLANEQGAELARVKARVRCVQPDAASLFPLQLGNQWIYRTRSRSQTGQTLTLRVARVAEHEGDVWFEVERRPAASASSFGWFREAAGRRILRKSALTASAVIYAEPSVARQFNHQGPLGDFPASIPVEQSAGLEATRMVFSPGIGLTLHESRLLTGSSGGFLEGWELVALRLADIQKEENTDQALQLAAESADLDISNRQVTNCAVPCYFFACGFAPGTDPPGTYKPCFRAQATARGGTRVELRLLDESGAVRYEASQPVEGETRLQRQIPLTAPGRFTLEARILSGAAAIQTSSLAVTVR